MKIVIHTDRLLLRTFTMGDAELIYELNSDPEVIQYTGDRVANIGEASAVLRDRILPQYQLYDHGRWAVLSKYGHEFIGWCGLKTRPERNEIDLGYRFMKKAWGNGYATEAALGCIKYGFETLQIKRIVGRAMPENLASIRVLEKCRMTYVCTEIIDNHPARTYEIFNPFVS